MKIQTGIILLLICVKCYCDSNYIKTVENNYIRYVNTDWIMFDGNSCRLILQTGGQQRRIDDFNKTYIVTKYVNNDEMWEEFRMKCREN